MNDVDALRVPDVIRGMAQTRPDVVAIRHRDRALTYAELDERSNRLAQVLLAAGAGPGSRVAHLDRSAPEVVELLAAASKIGAVAVPLNWRLSAPELTAIMTDAAAPLLLAGPAFAEVAAVVAAGVAHPLEVIGVGDDYEARLAAAGTADPGVRGEPGDPVLQMYTSGTTGVPKGVLTTHRNLAAATLNVPVWRFDEASVSLTPLPMFHVGGIGWTYLGLSQGATTILVSEFDAAAVLDLLESRARHQRGLRPDDPAAADVRAGRGRAGLLGPALDRLRRLADHDPRAQGGAADVRLPALRGVRPDRDDGRRRAAVRRGP